MERRELCCAFSGHRATKLPWGFDETHPACLDLKQRLHDVVFALYDEGCRGFYCGMANGCDLYFCEAVLDLRNQRPGVWIEAVIPWEGQAIRWPKDQQQRYNRLVTECDRQVLLQTRYTDDCMMCRNRYMVDRAEILLCVYDGLPGGTRATMHYAMRQGLQVVELPLE